MNAATPHSRGPRLILEHCARLGDVERRAPATSRLERRLGERLARLLIGALSGDHRRVARGFVRQLP